MGRVQTTGDASTENLNETFPKPPFWKSQRDLSRARSQRDLSEATIRKISTRPFRHHSENTFPKPLFVNSLRDVSKANIRKISTRPFRSQYSENIFFRVHYSENLTERPSQSHCFRCCVCPPCTWENRLRSSLQQGVCYLKCYTTAHGPLRTPSIT